MRYGATVFSAPVEFKTYGCGSCTDLPYCPSNSVDAEDEWIANVTISNLNNTSMSNDGYGDFTSLSADLMTYQTYTIGLSPGYSGFGYNEWFTVFIDFNQDGDFDDSDEEVFDVGSTTNVPVQGSVFVPGDAVLGSTRMRVVMKFNNEPTACEQGIAHGEVEDYCVNIMEGEPVSCEVPTMLFANNISIDSADFSWKRTTDAISYEVRVKPETVPNWQVILAQDTFFTASNLSECVDYECQVRSVCSGTKSNWSPSTLFKTKCIIGSVNNLPSDLLNWDIFPNPFNEHLEINIALKKPAFVNLEIYSANGVGGYKNSFQLNSGVNNLQLNSDKINSLISGIYFIKIMTPDGFAIKRVVKI
ncbi:MAG: GEVED domain-containing protein [Saprospiraceae bacterium]